MIPASLTAGLALGGRALTVFGSETLREARADAWFHAIVLAHLGAASVLAAAVGSEANLQPMLYWKNWLLPGLVLAVVVGAPIVLLRAILTAPRAPLGALMPLMRLILPRLLPGMILFSSLSVLMGVYTSVKVMLPRLAWFTWDPALADFDRWVHGGTDPWLLLRPLLLHPPVVTGIDFVYSNVWPLALVGMALWICLSVAHGHLRRRFLICYALSWVGLGNVVAALFVSAGPAYYAATTGDAARFAQLAAALADPSQGWILAPSYQQYLWSMMETGQTRYGGGISAFPSLHLAMATLMVLTARAVDRRWTIPGLAFVVLIQAGSVLLGWHYALDGYVSILAVAGAWWLTGRLLKVCP